LDYYIKGKAEGSQGSVTEDFCASAMKLSEAICNNDNMPSFAQYNCPNGCKDGACVLKEVNRYKEISQIVKEGIDELIEGGEEVILKEGDKIKENDFLVVYVPNNEDKAVILELEQFYNSTGVEHSRDRIRFRDFLSEKDYDAWILAEGKAEVTIYGNIFYIDYSGDGDDGIVRVFWGKGANHECVGDAKDIFTYEIRECETYELSAKARYSREIYYIDIRNEETDELICADKEVGETCKIGYMVLTIEDVDDLGNEGVLIYMGVKDGLFIKKGLYGGPSEVLNSKKIEFYEDKDDYFVISDCEVEEQTCENLIEKIKNPQDFSVGGFDFELSWNRVFEDYLWIDGKRYDTTTYASSWHSFGEDFLSISYNVLVVDDKNVDLNSWLEDRLGWEVCVRRDFYSEDNEKNAVYVCNWDILNNKQNLDEHQHKQREILWVNDNVAVNVYVYTGRALSDEELLKLSQKRINEFLDDLRDNSREFIGWEYLGIEWPFNYLIEKDLGLCSSDIEVGGCSPCWYCKTEPAVCPPHGYQTTTCVDYCCEYGTTERRIDCSPGICSGCYVPKWFEGFDNKCIPYGFRFEHQTDWDYKLVEHEEQERLGEMNAPGEIVLQVLSSTKAILKLYDRDGNEYEYKLVKGESVEIEIPDWEEDIEKMTLFVNDIGYSNIQGAENYVDLTIRVVGWGRYPLNAYCDIDGEVKIQKPDWGACQNNYECESNFCSGHECTGINQMIQEVTGFKALGARVLCKLADVFAIMDYEECVVQYLGEDYSEKISKE
jgi:hypothetical protein